MSDVLKWCETMAYRKPPGWSSRNTVTLRSPFALLRNFSTGHNVTPTLIFPPMAGHSSTIIDMETQSQIQLCLNAELKCLYAFDWLPATTATRNITVEDRLAFIDEAVNIIAPYGKINIIGNCQGGWEASIWAALHPEKVNTLTIAAAPINTGVDVNPAVRPLINWFQAAGEFITDLTLRNMILCEGGVHRGMSQIGFFTMMNPSTHLLAYLRLHEQINNPREVERFRRFYDWYLYPVDISGELYRWCVTRLFVNNELFRGRLTVGGRHVNLANITAPLFLLAGENDDITPASQVMSMADVVSSEQVEKYITAGGHLGVFIGRRSQSMAWRPILSQIREFSGQPAACMI